MASKPYFFFPPISSQAKCYRRLISQHRLKDHRLLLCCSFWETTLLQQLQDHLLEERERIMHQYCTSNALIMEKITLGLHYIYKYI